jgi:hypothetical protein
MYFIVLRKGIFLETFLSIQIKLMHGGFSTNLRPLIHSARSLLPSALATRETRSNQNLDRLFFLVHLAAVLTC